MKLAILHIGERTGDTVVGMLNAKVEEFQKLIYYNNLLLLTSNNKAFKTYALSRLPSV